MSRILHKRVLRQTLRRLATLAEEESKAASAFVKPTFDWRDPFLLSHELTQEETSIRDSAKAFSEEQLLPRIIEANRSEKYDRDVMKEMGSLGFLGATLPEEFGCSNASYTSYGRFVRLPSL